MNTEAVQKRAGRDQNILKNDAKHIGKSEALFGLDGLLGGLH
jgi:hypothetical protein